MLRNISLIAAALVLATGAAFAEDDAVDTTAEETEAAAPEAAPPEAVAKEAKSEAAVSLSRLAVCTDVEDRTPVGEADSFASDVGKLYCFTWVEATNSPTQLYHRWYIGDDLVNEIPIDVKARRWRCWSTKTIRPAWNGPCRVEIVTEEGDVVGTQEFTLTASAPAE